MTAPAPPFIRDLSGNGTGCSAAETSPSASPRALGGNPFNDGFRVLWHCAGEPVFRDHTGAIRPISLNTLRDLRRKLWTMARDATGRQRDRLCILWAEADEAMMDTVRWRQSACGIYLIQEQVA
jgi:hypothetical protein